MTTRQLADLIGKVTTYHASALLDFEVRVVDARMRFGNVDVLIQPVAGFGEQWITADRTGLRIEH
jgi:hypothetical protein